MQRQCTAQCLACDEVQWVLCFLAYYSIWICSISPVLSPSQQLPSFCSFCCQIPYPGKLSLQWARSHQAEEEEGTGQQHSQLGPSHPVPTLFNLLPWRLIAYQLLKSKMTSSSIRALWMRVDIFPKHQEMGGLRAPTQPPPFYFRINWGLF